MLDLLNTIMVKDTLQYLTAMIQIYMANIILLFFVPAMIWKSRLANKRIRDGILFCVGTQICYMVNLVLVLGFFNINNRYTLFLGIVLEYVFVRKVILKESVFSRTKIILFNIGYLFRGRKSLMLLANEIYSYCRRKISKLKKNKIVLSIKSHPVQSVVVTFFVIYNCYFITHQTMSFFSYQFSDLPVHTSWIYEMERGNIFSAGIYPFAMHCMIYFIHQLSGVMLRDVVILYGSFQTCLTIIFLYFLAEKLFKWRYSSYVVLTLFSLLFNQGRYGASLPQECGIFAIYGMAYFLIASLDEEPVFIEKNNKKKLKLPNLNYMLLAIYVGLVIAFHFYTAIAAIVVAFSIVASRLFRFLRWNYLRPIVLAALLGVVIAIAPFVAYLAKGYKFQESMDWAVSVISGEEWQGTGDGYLESLEGDGEYVEGSGGSVAKETEEEAVPIYKQGYSATELIKKMLTDMLNFIDGNGNMFKGYAAATVKFSLILGTIAGLLLLFIPKLRVFGENYLVPVFACGMLLFMGCCSDWGVLVIMEPPRVSSFIQPLLMLSMAIIFDLAVLITDIPYRLIFKTKGLVYFNSAITLAICGLIVFFIYEQNLQHSYFDVNLAYYNEPDYLIKQIRKENAPFTYSIVSPTDEYYAVVDKAYHVEISEFVAMVDGDEEAFKIPTKKVYFFIEKLTMQDYYYGSDTVNLDYAKEQFQYRASTQDYYYQRNIIESKAYYWALEYQKMYPNQMRKYFENDLYICFELTQEINAPFKYEFDYLKLATSGAD